MTKREFLAVGAGLALGARRDASAQTPPAGEDNQAV